MGSPYVDTYPICLVHSGPAYQNISPHLNIENTHVQGLLRFPGLGGDLG